MAEQLGEMQDEARMETKKDQRTLLLCFIHGFKGNEETFFGFPEELRNEVSQQLPELKVKTRIYPKYETRGDLAACVETFKEWLASQLITLEEEAGNHDPIQDRSVEVVLVAHSMGGFAAADTLFSILDSRPVSPDLEKELMFPQTHGLLTFDTPFNGLSRSLFTHGAINQYQNISSACDLLSTLSSPLAALSSAQNIHTASASAGTAVVQNNPSWKRWLALAARTGTVGAICAGGVLALQNREYLQKQISSITLPRCEDISIDPRKILTKKAGTKPNLTSRKECFSGLDVCVWSGGYFIQKRTFCAVPTQENGKNLWKETINTKAKDEIEAHCSMFQPEKNSSYQEMLLTASEQIMEWQNSDHKTVVDTCKPNR